jgi:hypothetical protein
MDESPDHEPTLIEWSMGVHLNHPITAQRETHNSRPARWELWMPHPFVPRRDGEGAYKQDGEHPSITLTGPRLGGSTHDYTSLQCTGRRRMPNTCAWNRRGRLKLTPRTRADFAKKPCRSTHAPARLWGLQPRVRSAPARNSPASRREERPISKHQPLRDPNGNHRRGSGATVGDSPGVP